MKIPRISGALLCCFISRERYRANPYIATQSKSRTFRSPSDILDVVFISSINPTGNFYLVVVLRHRKHMGGIYRRA